MDPDGVNYGHDDGVNFLATAQDEKGKDFESSFSILSLTEAGITIWNGKEKQIFGLIEFLDAAKERGFKRNSKIKSDADIVKAFQAF